MAPNSRPWETGGKGGDYKYQYHPGGNPKNAPKNAPSALHSVVVPNVNLPKVRAVEDDSGHGVLLLTGHLADSNVLGI
jgi:hypothetical protein